MAGKNTPEMVELEQSGLSSQGAIASPSKKIRSLAPQLTLQVKKINPEAQLPNRAYPHTAGYDLASAIDISIPAHGKALVSTGLSLSIPSGHYGRIAPRSGLASKYFIDVGAGVIDPDYRGEVKVLLFNFGNEDFQVKKGERIAQLILEKISTLEIEVVEELDDTVRGSAGFGSSGH